MLATENMMPEEVISGYFQFAAKFNHRKKWHEMSENELWQEICICILSSNVPYELAKSALFHLRDIGLLEPVWITNSPHSKEQIAYELSKQIYLPLKKDGSYRKYRFPNMRAKDIVNTAKVVYLNNSGLINILKNFNSEYDARNFLVENLAGLGLKEASHFLRNIGFSSSLAIIDSHIVSFLREISIIPQKSFETITPTTYVKLERILQEISGSLDMNLSILDMVIWQYMRSR